MIEITVVTLFPEMIRTLTGFGITGRALQNGLFTLQTINPRDYTRDRHRTVDDRPYGGGPGMVMMVQPLRSAIVQARQQLSGTPHVVYLTPEGRRLDQSGINELVARKSLVLIAGRYEGVDARLLEQDVDEEWSIGDYVLSGGELAAMVIIDSMIRTLPGALGHADSVTEDSFASGLLDYPDYTRPEQIDGQTVPAVLLSGDHQAIERWRRKQALGRTWRRRPELLEKIELDGEQRRLLDEFIEEYSLGVRS